MENLSCPDGKTDGHREAFLLATGYYDRFVKELIIIEKMRNQMRNTSNRFEKDKYILIFYKLKITFFWVFFLGVNVVYLYMQVLNIL